MPNFETSALFEAPFEVVLSVIKDVGAYAEYMPGVVAAQVTSILDESPDCTPLEYDAEVSVGLSMFNGKLGARIAHEVDAGRLSISLIKGPVRRAECKLHVAAVDEVSSVVVWNIDYETPSPVLDKLIARYQEPAFHRVKSAFQERAREVALQLEVVR